MIINNEHIKLLHIQLNLDDGAFVIIQFNELLYFNKLIDYKNDYIIIEDKLITNIEIIKIDKETLSLSINCYDMGTYYLDSTVNFLKEKGMQPKDRFAEVVSNANKAINELRKEIAKFLVDYQDDNWEDFEQLEKMLSDKIFTDRELVYKRKYEK